MEKRVSYFVSRKSLLVWLSALVMTASAVLRIAYSCGKGADAATVWFQIVLPVAACLIFVLMILLGGQERFYHTAIPAFLLAIYYSVRVSAVLTSLSLRFVFWVAYLAMAGFYAMTVSGRVRNNWALVLLLAVGIGVLAYTHRIAFTSGNWSGRVGFLPELLFLTGGFFAVLAMQPHADGKYHPTWGDRVDGRKLRTLDPVQIVANYIMPTRVGSSNFVRDSVEITAMERYIREKRRAGLTSFGITHVFLAAYVRTVAKYPALNRFLSGQQVYSRGDDIQFCMMVKEEMSTDAAESAMKLHLTPTDSVEDIYRKMNEQVTRIKEASDASDFDKTAKLLSLIPGVVFKFVVWVLKVWTTSGCCRSSCWKSARSTARSSLPRWARSAFRRLCIICMTSATCRCSARSAASTGRTKLIWTAIWSSASTSILPVNTDERICDGFYFATALKHMKKYLQHPERLDEPLDEVVKDVD